MEVSATTSPLVGGIFGEILNKSTFFIFFISPTPQQQSASQWKPVNTRSSALYHLHLCISILVHVFCICICICFCVSLFVFVFVYLNLLIQVFSFHETAINFPMKTSQHQIFGSLPLSSFPPNFPSISF